MMVQVCMTHTIQNFITVILNLIYISLVKSSIFSCIGNMMGKTKGAGPRINREYPKAIPLWCASHQLNRVIVQSCTEQAIRNMIGTVDSVGITMYTLFDVFTQTN